MKFKIIAITLIFTSFTAYSEETETHELPPITGTWYGGDMTFSSLASGTVQPPNMNGMTTYGTNWSMVADAQMKAAVEAGKKAEAAAKAAKKRECVEAALTRNNDKYEDVTERLALQGGDCQREFSHVPETMAVCIKQANWHFEEASKGLDAQLEVDKAWCIKTYGS
jgi:hypothetical protein